MGYTSVLKGNFDTFSFSFLVGGCNRRWRNIMGACQ